MSVLMPEHIPAYLDELDEFIEQKLQPIEQADDNMRFFDHRREYARTDWENDGLPTAEWEALLGRARDLARDAGHLAFALPGEYGGGDATNQAIQFRLAELHADYELVKALTFQVAAEMDRMSKPEVAQKLSEKVAICNYRANQLACKAADEAIQVHGGIGYSRYKQFEHHYRDRKSVV